MHTHLPANTSATARPEVKRPDCQSPWLLTSAIMVQHTGPLCKTEQVMDTAREVGERVRVEVKGGKDARGERGASTK